MMVKLDDGKIVNPDHVVSVSRDYYNRYLIVKTILGDALEVQPRYGESIYDAETRIIAAMDAVAKGGAA